MFNNHSARFIKRFPGPYRYYRSTDGVDDTFDVICMRTEQHIVSVHFWDDPLPCELIARVVSAALNDQILSDDDESAPFSQMLGDRKISAFRGMHPGPYGTAKFTCELGGPGWEVRCMATGESVIAAYGSGFRSHARTIAAHIANSLNNLP